MVSMATSLFQMMPDSEERIIDTGLNMSGGLSPISSALIRIWN